MSSRIECEADLNTALAHLIELDPRLNDLLAIAGRPPLRKRPGGFQGLASIVVSQQLSTASAAAIWGRLTVAFDPFEHRGVLAARKTKLQRLGLSAPKISTLKCIARAIERDGLDLDALADLPADEAHRALTIVKGVGPWTADIYLLFCIGHADAFPADDLALQEAARIAFKKRKRPSAKQLERLSEVWRPWRGVAACLLWSYYRAVKRRDAVPVQQSA